MNKLLNLLKKYQDILAYLVFGGFTLLINLIVFYVATKFLNWNYGVANLWAWFLSVLFAYLTNRIWVFHSHFINIKSLIKEALSFFTARGLTLILDMGILWIGISLLHQNEMLTKIVDQIIVVLANYFLSKWFVFSKKS